jgi:chorismate mutase
MLMGTEAVHSSCRRYTSPEEHAFFPQCLPPPLPDLATLHYPPDLLSSTNSAASISHNADLLSRYVHTVIPLVCQQGDDDQHGSAVLADVVVLQALSKRVHYGKFVAESKYQADPRAYEALVRDKDVAGVYALLTNRAVEEKVLQRAKIKAATYGKEPLVEVDDIVKILTNQDGRGGRKGSITAVVAAAAAAAAVNAVEMANLNASDMKSDMKIRPAAIEAIYRDLIIPMTKEVEVEYLFLRCGKQPPVGWRDTCRVLANQ